jgi:hypothetical protein
MMNTLDKHHRSKLPRWQSEKMRTLIEERWSEVWEVVMARKHSKQNLPRLSRNSRRNSSF